MKLWFLKMREGEKERRKSFPVLCFLAFLTIIFTEILLVCEGCAPAMRPISPEINGQVSDQNTRLPISNAQVHLQGMFSSEMPTINIVTNEFGKFHIKKQSTLTFVPLFLAWDFPPSAGQLIIKVDGYKEYRVDYITGRSPVRICIELEPEESKRGN